MSRPAQGSFCPNTAGTVTVAATTTSGSTRVALVGRGTDLLVYNDGNVTAFFEQGTAASTAATNTGMPVAPGAYLCVGRQDGSTHAIAITASGSATLYVTTGEGT